MKRQRIGLSVMIATNVAIIAVGALQALAISITESLLPKSWGWTDELWVWVAVLALSTGMLVALVRAQVKSGLEFGSVDQGPSSIEAIRQNLVINGHR
jgi:hypothetical protein